MRRTSIWLSSVAVFVASVCTAAELQFDMFPDEPKSIEIDLFGSPEPKQQIEFDLFAVVDKCPCPEGECTCDPEDCVCPDCPEHSKPDENVEYVDITKGRHVLLFTASWCPTCPAAKERLGDLLSEVVSVDMDERPDLATEYNVTGIPAAVLVEDGRAVNRCIGQHVGKTIVGNWLNPVSKSTNQYSGSPQYYSAPTYQYSSPRYYSTPNYFQGYSSGGCATCR